MIKYIAWVGEHIGGGVYQNVEVQVFETTKGTTLKQLKNVVKEIVEDAGKTILKFEKMEKI